MIADTEKQAILQVLEQYKKAIHTQKAEDFLPIWTEDEENVLISPAGCFRGTAAIYEEFLLGRIQKAYSRIDLISKEVSVRLLTADVAVVVFSYCTDCDRRDTGEPYGIEGLETQIYQKQQNDWKLVHIQYSGKPIEHGD